MNDLRFNSIAGTVLAAGLTVVGLRIVSENVFQPQFPKKPGYDVDISAFTTVGGGGVEAKKEEGPIDWAKVLADPALPAAGEKIAVKCKSCHNLDKGGPNLTGPNLWGVIGRTAGTHEGFNYSAALKGYAQPWTYDNINKFIASPQADMKGTLMTFVGLKKQDERTAMIAYLRTLADSPAPLPPPLPPSAAAPPESAAPASAAPAAPAPSAKPR
jgi:cytochrome c